jgi:hypothetical protein
VIKSIWDEYFVNWIVSDTIPRGGVSTIINSNLSLRRENRSSRTPELINSEGFGIIFPQV